MTTSPGPQLPPPRSSGLGRDPVSGPAPYSWSTSPKPPAVIDVGKANTRRLVFGSVVAGLTGLGQIIVAPFGVELAGWFAMLGVAFGAGFLLVSLLPVIERRWVFRPRHLVIEQSGVRWDDPCGNSWAVAWGELAAVSISSRRTAFEADLESLSDKVTGRLIDRVTMERALWRLDLFLADSFLHRHPELRHLWTGDRFRQPLGHSTELVRQIDAAFRVFQPASYRGVESKRFLGLRWP